MPPKRPLSQRERIKTVRLYYRYNGDIRALRREWRRLDPQPPPSISRIPTSRAVRSIVARFVHQGSVHDRPRAGKPRSSTAPAMIEVVRASMLERPILSLRKRAHELGVSRTSLFRILHRDLGARAYKIQIAQMLKPLDIAARLLYSTKVLQLLNELPELPERLIMSDEAHFQLSGEVFNRQNVRFWGTKNPQIIRTKDPHAPRLTVWCGLTAHAVIGPYFFMDERDERVSVTGERYRIMLRDYVIPSLRNSPMLRDINDWWWQQDAATAHTAGETMQLLRDTFGNRIISQRIVGRPPRRPRLPTADEDDSIIWPSRSPDLSAPDFFLWGYLKERVYGVHDTATVRTAENEGVSYTSPNTLLELRRNIDREIELLNRREARPLLRAVMLQVFERARECLQVQGKHLRGVMFKTT